ncbi:TPA: DGQHR domain-containing protein [Vibrio parahaemolyticus]|nr:DGQHR domain-containing protein [Vibrio parahaemolyticus]
MKKIVLDVLKISQPIGEFYFGKIKSRDLFEIAEADVRRMEGKNREVENYLGIQRPLKKNRVDEIRNYIPTVDATFPNSIIISVDSDNSYFNEEGQLVLEYEEKSKIATILDGQHRLAGFENSTFEFDDEEGNTKEFELLVTIFVNPSMDIQAKVFTMVNQNQTKVNKSLVYDLESLSLSRSPWKTGHDIAVFLNKSDKTAFYKRIKRLGVKSSKEAIEPITQAAFVNSVVELISDNPQDDRNYILRTKRSFFKNGPSSMDKESLKSLPFRRLFYDDKEELILKVINNYFNAVSSIWKEEWKKTNKDSILNKTIGLQALFRLLGFILGKYISENESDIHYEYIDQAYFERILLTSDVEKTTFYSMEAVSKSNLKLFSLLKSGMRIDKP